MSVNPTNHVSSKEPFVVKTAINESSSSVKSNALSTDKSTTKKIKPINNQTSETTKKTDSVVRSCLDKCFSLVNIFKKFKVALIKKISMVFELMMRVFPIGVRSRANDAGIGLYKGEKIVNANAVAVSAKDEIIVKGESVDLLRKRITKAHTESFVISRDPLNTKRREVPEQFAGDLLRSKFRFNDEILYNNRDAKDINEDEIEDVKNATLFNVSEILVNRFGNNAFFNIAALLNQSSAEAFITHLSLDIPNKPISKNHFYLIGSDSNLDSCYALKDEGDKVHLNITYILQVTNGNNFEEIFGFVPVNREIILSKKDLETDWSKTEDKNITPSIEVVDTYKPFCQTLELAQDYYDDLIK